MTQVPMIQVPHWLGAATEAPAATAPPTQEDVTEVKPGRGRVRRLGTEVARFGTVGALAFVIDVGLFNVLRAWILADSPLTAKTISVVTATAFSYLGNRHWTYRDRPRTGTGRETSLFLFTNAVALLISWACLATTHYLLGLDSQLADNISGNVIAVGLGTLFRFWTYRTWVFPEELSDAVPAEPSRAR